MAFSSFYDSKLGQGRISQLLKYDLTSQQWASPRILNNREITVVDHNEAVVFNDAIYILGGQGIDGSAIDDVLKYDSQSGELALTCRLDSRRSRFAAATSGRMFALGGINSNGSVLNTFESCDPRTGRSWFSDRTPMPIFCKDHTAVTIGNDIYLLGGNWRPDSNNKFDFEHFSILRFDTRTNVWAKEGNLTSPRSGHCSVLGGDGCIYTLGGTSQEVVTSTVERFDPSVGLSCNYASFTPSMSPVRFRAVCADK